jgi:threonine synthase
MTAPGIKGARGGFVCFSCNQPYPLEGFPHKCPKCGGFFDQETPLPYSPPDPAYKQAGIGRYQGNFPLEHGGTFITLGEGDTPLVTVTYETRTLYFKCEHLNPTGSFKDRGTAVLINALAAEGVSAAVEDSSGNAGASFAGYAARAGIQARVFVPEAASGPKQAQIEAFGAEIIRIPGARSTVSEAAQAQATQGSVYASHTYLPHGLSGMATIAYEIVEQLGRAPKAVLTPVGQGTLFLGLYRGFRALKEADVIQELPQLIGVQALACAPLWAVYSAGAAGLTFVQEGETMAEGIRIVHPLRGDLILQALDETRGMMLAVEEKAILPARDQLARHGLYVEPTSAVVWAALEQCLADLEDPVVLMLTGTGFKSSSD